MRCVYGGVPRGPQIRGVKDGVDILVATPGRLLDFTGFKQASLESVTFLGMCASRELWEGLGFLLSWTFCMCSWRRVEGLSWVLAVSRCGIPVTNVCVVRGLRHFAEGVRAPTCASATRAR